MPPLTSNTALVTTGGTDEAEQDVLYRNGRADMPLRCVSHTCLRDRDSSTTVSKFETYGVHYPNTNRTTYTYAAEVRLSVLRTCVIFFQNPPLRRRVT
jgi:hypothetical protein